MENIAKKLLLDILVILKPEFKKNSKLEEWVIAHKAIRKGIKTFEEAEIVSGVIGKAREMGFKATLECVGVPAALFAIQDIPGKPNLAYKPGPITGKAPFIGA